MDAVSGTIIIFGVVAVSTVFCYLGYQILRLIVKAFAAQGEPRYFKMVVACLLVLPMLVLVWDFTYSETVFTALPLYLTGLIVMVSVLKSNLNPKFKIGLSGVYLLMGVVFIGQAIV
ncbi:MULTISPECIES: hypothetical protein [unclassified Leeuwenhoekiella]|uniref:hypothetical protein n=1 Tax=unclassified Leeuwenhoekiella TaxID=2615029 RepID=UPI000C6651D1|nr:MULTISPECIES: hypothetical protein [unclassified Leeuwenhoekiella]MBA80444.1 hypothetical protein [Leeuwenhoekiella sp.]|tara:strand:- start:30802 stop:31152 length:351 start_codon:yes stop_codon:yes gene_type:complete